MGVVMRAMLFVLGVLLAVVLFAGGQTACASNDCDARVFVCQGNHIADCISGDFGGRYYGEQVGQCYGAKKCVESHLDAFCAISETPDPRCKSTEDQKSASVCADGAAVRCEFGYALAEERCPATCEVRSGIATCS